METIIFASLGGKKVKRKDEILYVDSDLIWRLSSEQLSNVLVLLLRSSRFYFNDILREGERKGKNIQLQKVNQL